MRLNLENLVRDLGQVDADESARNRETDDRHDL